MPRGDPFSQLCRRAAELRRPVVADLHTHTLASDGAFTPSQVLAFARRARLQAAAITDHDTLAGFDEARKEAEGIRLIPGVEMTVLWNGRETHLLAYGFDPDDDDVRPLLEKHCELRRTRFAGMIEALRAKGIELEIENLIKRTPSVGRGNLARLLANAGHSPREAMADLRIPTTPFTEIATAVGVIHNAGGICSLAHPRAEATRADLEELKFFGVDAIEAFHPSVGPARRNELLAWAGELGMTVTGGSDCHGPGPRSVGSCGLKRPEFEALRFA